jgi:hypothetical protein
MALPEELWELIRTIRDGRIVAQAVSRTLDEIDQETSATAARLVELEGRYGVETHA